jgi:predicted nucleic acid-binding protein
MKEIVSLAREHGLSTYELSYLDLSMRLELTLAQQDASLLKAARKCKVPAFLMGRAS